MMYNPVVGRKRKHNKNYPQHLREKKGWFYYVVQVKGKTKWFPLQTRDLNEALKRWAEVEASLKAEPFDTKKIEQDDNRISLSVLVERFMTEVAVHLAEKTRAGYKRMGETVKERFGEQTAVDKITRQEIIRWHDELRGKPFEANRRIAFLRVVFQKAVDWGFLSVNPCDKIKKFQEKRHKLTLSEEILFKKIYPVAEPMLKRAIMLAFHLVQHENEVKSLQWKDFDLAKSVVSFTRRKTDEDIVIDYSSNPTLVAFMEHVRANRRELSPYIVCHKAPLGWVPYSHFRSLWKNALDKAGYIDKETGVPQYKFKEIRHLANTEMKDSGITADKRKAMTGHKTVQANEVYTHPSGSDTVDSSRALGRFRPDKF